MTLLALASIKISHLKPILIVGSKMRLQSLLESNNFMASKNQREGIMEAMKTRNKQLKMIMIIRKI